MCELLWGSREFLEGEKNGFGRLERLKMVEYEDLPRAFTDVVAGTTTSMTGATRLISSGPDFHSFGMGFSILFLVGGSG